MSDDAIARQATPCRPGVEFDALEPLKEILDVIVVKVFHVRNPSKNPLRQPLIALIDSRDAHETAPETALISSEFSARPLDRLKNRWQV